MRAFDILSTTPFRRLAAKQQVFGLMGDDHCRTRYSHSVETAEIGVRLLEEAAHRGGPAADRKTAQTVEAACLIHDIGMPPFGHKGEARIRAWVAAERPRLSEFGAGPYAEYAAFDSNAQGLRLIYYHPQFAALRAPAAAPIVAAAMKYPWTRAASNAPKCGILASELEAYRRLAAAAGLAERREEVFERHPLSYIVEVADDIAYLSADIEDAARLGVIDHAEFEELFLPFAPAKTGARRQAPVGAERGEDGRGLALWRFRGRLVDQLVGLFGRLHARTPGRDGLAATAEAFFNDPAVGALKARSAAFIYRRRDVLDAEPALSPGGPAGETARASSVAVMDALLRAVFSELAERAGGGAQVAEVVARFRAKRADLAARSSPMQLTVDLVSEFTDRFSLSLIMASDR